MSVRDKWVRRFSIDETAKHKNGFTIYKITSVLFPLESPEAVTVVSVWKRYSDVQQLHKSMKSLHTGLHLKGIFPQLAKSSFFKRFSQEVIDERAKTIKALLEFVAEHRLLFTSTDFVHFLQTGYPEPEPKPTGVINAIRSSLHLPIEETPPLEYQTSDDEARSPAVTAQNETPETIDRNIPIEIDVSQIPIHEPIDVEIRESPKTSTKISESDSFESINSIDSLDSDLYDELNKLTIDKARPSVKRNVLPDLINFDAPSTSKFEDYHTMPRNKDLENSSMNSTVYGTDNERQSESRTSVYSKMSLPSLSIPESTSGTDSKQLFNRSVPSLSNLGSTSETDDKYAFKSSVTSLSIPECGNETEDSYIFSAGYALNLASSCEQRKDYQGAFDYYKSAIEKMLIGVKADTNQQRRVLIKEKINKYLAYAEEIYKDHLCDTDQGSSMPAGGVGAPGGPGGPARAALPAALLRLGAGELRAWRVLALRRRALLVLHERERTPRAMKIIQKIPRNLTEFDNYFHQRAEETRQPILPTVIPYMVPLHAYIETDDLIFLILAYAPGGRLFDYIKNYKQTPPDTREVNLENIFTDPMKNKDPHNDNTDVTDSKISSVDNKINVTDDVNDNVQGTDVVDNVDVSVNQLMINSQRLLLNVDRVLTEAPSLYRINEEETGVEVAEEEREKAERENVIKDIQSNTSEQRSEIPPSAVCRWGAEMITALESLHNCGVIWRDLRPHNVLLGARGQLLLSYCVAYAGADVARARLVRERQLNSLYVAPELLWPDHDQSDPACDFWSFGAIMYELICGFPLSRLHGAARPPAGPRLPPRVPLAAASLLTQLLAYDPAERLGSGKDGIEEIKQHPYFKNIDWQEVYDSWIVPD